MNRAPHPAPEVINRPATDDETPAAARRMARLAKTNGWAVRVTYARGTAVGRTPKVVDSIAVRMHKVNLAAWGVWVEGRFDSGQTWTRGEIAKSVGAKALAAWLVKS